MWDISQEVVILFNMDLGSRFILETGHSLIICSIDYFFLLSLEIYSRGSIVGIAGSSQTVSKICIHC